MKHPPFIGPRLAATPAIDRTALSLGVIGSLMGAMYLLAFGSLNFNKPAGMPQVALLALMALFVWSYFYYRGRLQPRHLAIVVVFSLFFCFLVIWMTPSSVDVYYHVFYAKIYNDYDINPYEAFLTNFSSDSFFDVIPYTWLTLRLPYGPVWLLLYAPVQLLAGESSFTNALLFKLLGVGAFFASGWLLYYLLKRVAGSGSTYPLLLYFWNPLFISEIAREGHHDSWVALLLLLALVCYAKGWRWLVLLPVLLAAFFKFVPVIVLPLVYLFLVREESGWRRRVAFTGGALILPLIALYGVLQLLVPMPTALSLFGQAVFVYSSVFTYLLAVFFPNILLPIQDARLVGWSLGLFVAWYIFIMIRARGGLVDLAKTVAFGLLAYLLFGAFWVWPWYFVWIIPLLLLLPAPYLKLATYLSLTTFLGYYLFSQALTGFAIMLPLAAFIRVSTLLVKRLTNIDLWKYL